MHRSFWPRRFAPRRLAALSIVVCWLAHPARGQTTISSPQLTVSLNPKGIAAIQLMGRTVTTGGGMALWDDKAIPTSPGTLPTPTEPSAAQVRTEPGVGIVDQTFNALHVVWTYTVSGYDLSADIAVTNTAALPFERLFFQLPQFQFARRPTGFMRSWHYTYYANQWTSLAHPSVACPLAVSDAYDDAYAIAIHCKSHFDHPVLINSNWDQNLIPAQCIPYVYVQDSVAPGATAHVLLNIRVTDQRNLVDRLGAYVSDFQKWAGPMRYEPDDRPVIGCFPESATWITRANPLGLSRRLDTAFGVSSFEWMISRAVPWCQGPLFWQPQGANPRGVEFRPDFDVWPPTFRTTFTPLLAWCNQHGMRPGLQTRPLSIVTPLNATADTDVLLCPQEPTQVNMLLNRFVNTNAAGAGEYYLDSFGFGVRSYQLMRLLRDKLGPSIPTYSEQTTDLMLPLSGVYCDVTDSSLDTLWFSQEMLKVFRLLYPNSTFIARTKPSGDQRADRAAHTLDDFASARLSPIIVDAEANPMAADLQKMHDTYYRGNLWGPAAGRALDATTQP